MFTYYTYNESASINLLNIKVEYIFTEELLVIIVNF